MTPSDPARTIDHLQQDQIGVLLRAEVSAHNTGAAVAIIREGDCQFARGYGLANIEWDLPVSPDTIFALGSISKPLTALAIMTLIEDGRLALATPIGEVLPPLQNAVAPVTVAHLLTHTSGVRSFNGTLDFIVRLGRQHISAKELLAHVVQRPCDFVPGTKWRYSNSGYALLAYLIEAASGLSFANYMQERLFGPLGMTRSSSLHDNAILTRRAYDYQSGPHGTERARFVSSSWFRGSGSLVSTVEDLARLEAALVEGRVVSPASFARMLEPVRLEDGTTYPYGLGWGVTQYLGRPVHHHAGSLGGYCGEYCRLPSDRLAIIVLANHRDFPFHRVTCRLVRIALGVAPPNEPNVLGATDVDLREIAGDFVSGDGDELSVDPENGRFRCRGSNVGLFALSGDGDLHEIGDPEVVLRLDREHSARVSALTLETPMFADRRFVRVDDAQ